MEKRKEIYWCGCCRATIINITPQKKCLKCEKELEFLGKDLRPVFSIERIILEFYGFDCLDDVVWKSVKSKVYFINGKSRQLPGISALREDLVSLKQAINSRDDYGYLDKKITEQYKETLKINYLYLQQLEDEAFNYINEMVEKYSDRKIFVSFSGGKDSTVVSSLVRRAIGKSDIMHVFGDTTLEDDFTYEYIKDFQKGNPLTPLLQHRSDHDFYSLVEVMGPPSKVMRWCCTIFKTGPINELFNEVSKNSKVITFYGIRRSESIRRQSYEQETDGAKIGTQVSVSPIIDWIDFEIWMYLICNDISFNKAYNLGFTRVGCWLCPLNSNWSDFLVDLHYPEEAEKWREILISFAKKIGKKDAEVYVDEKNWARRFGGAGLENRFTGLDVKPCGEIEGARQIVLNRAVNDSLIEFMKPLGEIDLNNGKFSEGEFYLNIKNSPVKIFIQAPTGSKTIRVAVLNAGKDEDLFHSYVRNQIIKFDNCIACTACKSICPQSAIFIEPNGEYYKINDRCNHCMTCVTHYGSAGCLVAKSLGSYGESG